MPLWTLWDKTKPPAEAVIHEHRSSINTADGELPDNMDPSLAWLQEMHAPEPVYDASTHKLKRNEGVVAIDPQDTRTGTRTWGFEAVELSAKELKDAARMAFLQSEAAPVGAIVKTHIEEGGPMSATDATRLTTFMAVRDGLDEQAP